MGQSFFSGINIASLNSPKAIKSTLEGIQAQKDDLMAQMEAELPNSGIDPATFAAFKAGDQAAQAKIAAALGESEPPSSAPPSVPAVGGPAPAKPMVNPFGEKSPIVNPFQIADDIKQRGDVVQSELDRALNFAQQNRLKVDENQQTERGLLEYALAQKRLINSQDEQADRDFAARVKPLLDEKTRIDLRLAELAQDNNPLNSLRAIFDSDFNEEKLRKTSAKLEESIQGLGMTYSVASDLRAQDFESINRRLNDDLALTNLDKSHSEEDLRANSIALQAAEQNFQFPGALLKEQTQILVAQMAQRDDFLANQDPASITSLLGQASKTGSVVVEGIPISKAALEEIAKKNEALDLQLKSARLAYASNQIQHGDLVMRKAMQYMTVEQLNAAKAAGGMFRGMKLPPAEIDARIAEGIQARVAAASGMIEMQGAPTALNQAATMFSENLSNVRKRLLSTYGGIPTALNPAMAQITQAGNQMTAAIRAAKSPAEISAISAAWLPKIQALQQGFDKQVDAIGTTMGEGDPVAAEFSKKFLRGEPLTQKDALRFGEHFSSKGEIPSIIRSSPGGKAVIEAYANAKKTVEDQITAQGLKGINANQKRTMIEREFNKTAPKVVASQSFDELHSKLPAIAKSLQSPIGDISTAQWARANAAGDARAQEYLAKTLGIKPEEAAVIFQRGDPRITKDMRSKMAATRYSGLLEALDETPGWKGSDKPSDAFVNLLASPAYLNRVMALDAERAKGTIGGMAANGVASGELTRMVATSSQQFTRMQAERRATSQAGSFLGASRFSADGLYRARAVLGAIPNLTPVEEKELLGALKDRIRGSGAFGDLAQGAREVSGLMQSNASSAAVGDREFEVITGMITDSKFENPRLERIRKIAAKSWQEQADSVARAVDRLSKGDEE